MFTDVPHHMDVCKLFIHQYLTPMVLSLSRSDPIDIDALLKIHLLPFLRKLTCLVRVCRVEDIILSRKESRAQSVSFRRDGMDVSRAIPTFLLKESWITSKILIVEDARRDALESDTHPLRAFARVCYMNFNEWVCFVRRCLQHLYSLDYQLHIKKKLVVRVHWATCALDTGPIFNPLFCLKFRDEDRFGQYRFLFHPRFGQKGRKTPIGYEYAILLADLSDGKQKVVDVCRDAVMRLDTDGGLVPFFDRSTYIAESKDAKKRYIGRGIISDDIIFGVSDGVLTEERKRAIEEAASNRRRALVFTYSFTSRTDKKKYANDAVALASRAFMDVAERYRTEPICDRALSLVVMAIRLFYILLLHHGEIDIDLPKIKKYIDRVMTLKDDYSFIPNAGEILPECEIDPVFLSDVIEMCEAVEIPGDREYIVSGFIRANKIFDHLLTRVSEIKPSSTRRRRRTRDSTMKKLQEYSGQELETFYRRLQQMIEKTPSPSPKQTTIQRAGHRSPSPSSSSQSQTQSSTARHPLFETFHQLKSARTGASRRLNIQRILQTVHSTRQSDAQRVRRDSFMKQFTARVLKKIPGFLRGIKDPFDVAIIDGLNIIRSFDPATREIEWRDGRFYPLLEAGWEDTRDKVRQSFSPSTIIFWILPVSDPQSSIKQLHLNEYRIGCPLLSDLDRRNDDAAVIATALFFQRQREIASSVHERLQETREVLQRYKTQIQNRTFLNQTNLALVHQLPRVERYIRDASVFESMRSIIVVSRDKYRDWGNSLGDGISFHEM